MISKINSGKLVVKLVSLCKPYTWLGFEKGKNKQHKKTNKQKNHLVMK